MIVAIQTIGRTLPGRKSFELRSVHQENIEPAVVVVIEERDSIAGGLNDVFLGIDATKDILRRESGSSLRCRRRLRSERLLRLSLVVQIAMDGREQTGWRASIHSKKEI